MEIPNYHKMKHPTQVTSVRTSQSINNQSEVSDSHPVPATKKHRRGSKTTKRPSSNARPYSLRNRNRQLKVNQDAREELI